MGKTGGLRSALGQAPDPRPSSAPRSRTSEAASSWRRVFDAFFSIYLQRSLDLFRIYRAGGGVSTGGDLPAPLAERLFDEVDAIATRIFNTCVRALDYCPARSMSLSATSCAPASPPTTSTRASTTWGVRDALMQAFRRRGIKPPYASFFSDDALRWPLVEADRLSAPGPRFVGLPEPVESSREHNQRALHTFVEENAEALGLRPGGAFDVHPLEVSRVVTADSTLHVALSTQVIQKRGAARRVAVPRGVSLVFDGTGKLRYAIPGSAS